MKIALAQLNYTIGAFAENSQKIVDAIDRSRSEGANLVAFSELSVCGYPPLDLLEHKHFIENCKVTVESILPNTKDIAVVLGVPTLNKRSEGKNLYNSALFIHDGKILHEIHKALLPTYDIFDEYRYFQPSEVFEIIEFMGKRLAVTICEDLWYEQPLLTNFGKDKLYTINPMEILSSQQCDVVINIAASPFAHDHNSIKNSILIDNARKYKAPIFYVNQVGAHTDLIFDGASRVINSKGITMARMAAFREDLAFFDLEEVIGSGESGKHVEATGRIEMIHDALVLGISDYFVKMKFTHAILGLSGGIDSAVTLVLATEALGAENVRVLLMPSQYSSIHSVSDAEELTKKLGVKYDIIPIRELFSLYLKHLDPVFKNLPSGIAEENIQARIRGTLLMAISNKFGNLLLNTSNKSEIAVGYGTLYGDMSGGLSVLGDIYKTDVYRLAHFINSHEEIIPANTIRKPPSAELRPDQKDSDSLPDYELLDQILYNYIELRKPVDELVTEGFAADVVQKIVGLVNANEYKRFQTPPILRISSKAFGYGRRMPLVARY
jgi:NAD+ synthase (glutamine-hydrolysing)